MTGIHFRSHVTNGVLDGFVSTVLTPPHSTVTKFRPGVLSTLHTGWEPW